MITTGTVTGHNALLLELRDWLVNTVGWTEIEISALPSPVVDTTVITLTLRAPGATSGDEYFVTFETAANAGSGQYGWSMRASVDFDVDLPIGSQAAISNAVWFNTWQNTIDYWFYANDRRVIVIAKVNVSYVGMYAGLFLPYCLPTEYRRPFYVSGNYVELAAHDVSNTRNRMLADPGQATAYMLNRAGNAWKEVGNHRTGSTDINLLPNPEAFVWPHRSGRVSSNGTTTGWSTQTFQNMRPNLAGELPLFQTHLVNLSDGIMAGALEGVFSAPGFNRTSEQELTFGSKGFTLFQNVFRTTPRDFMAIEEL